MSLGRTLFGRPLKSEESEEAKIGAWTGVPALGLDALASAAYGPEAALTIFLLGGVSGIRQIVPITGAIIALLFLVQLSYRQTIAAYPGGGGSFTVAKENLGIISGLLAASALFFDYLLNVAVAVSAGVGALVSAVPKLLPQTLWLCLGILLLLTLINLRGIRTAGKAFLVPTYAFVTALAASLVVGAARAFSAGGHPQPVTPIPVPQGAEAAGLWLVARAFASGCTAMTGIEAVSNGVPVFLEPQVKRAQRTLTAITSILACLLAGIAWACHAYRIGATLPGREGYESVLSQLAAAVAGRGIFYDFAIGSVIAVLCLSANTSFADFPRICRLLALDEFLPEGFAHQGRRLVYSEGVVLLAVLSGALLIAFRGITDRLIPLFAVGAFTAFTMSQMGMVVHWRRANTPRARYSMIVNALGAAGTATTLVLIVVSKFTEGAWISLLCIGGAMGLLWTIRAHFRRLDLSLADDAPLELTPEVLEAPIVVVPIKRLDRVTRRALQFAASISDDVEVVQVRAESRNVQDLPACWDTLVRRPMKAAGLREPKVTILKSSYRELVDPLLSYVHRLARENGGRTIAVVVPDLIERRWYHALLHSHTAREIELMLLLRGGPRVVVVAAPWHTADWRRKLRATVRHARRPTGAPARP